MTYEKCPLGYECDTPANCTQIGLRIAPELATVAEVQGLTVDHAEAGVVFVEFCSGPRDKGYLTALAETAIDLRPDITKENVAAYINRSETVQNVLIRAAKRKATVATVLEGRQEQ